MTEPVLDCYGNDLTRVIRLRQLNRVARKVRNFVRYERMRNRLPHVIAANEANERKFVLSLL